MVKKIEGNSNKAKVNIEEELRRELQETKAILEKETKLKEEAKAAERAIMAEFNMKKGNSGNKRESREDSHTPITGTQLEPEPDFFFVEDKDENFYYYFAKDNPREVRKLERHGYEVVNSTNSSSGEEAVSQRSKIDSTIGIPEHVLMRTKKENRKRLLDLRNQRDQENNRKMEQNVKDLNKALERGGLGSIQHYLKSIAR